MSVARNVRRASKKFGATGKYPDGSYGRHDEGELRFGVARDNYGNVRIDFGKPVAWMAMKPELAIELARLLLRHAGARSS